MYKEMSAAHKQNVRKSSKQPYKKVLLLPPLLNLLLRLPVAASSLFGSLGLPLRSRSVSLFERIKNTSDCV